VTNTVHLMVIVRRSGFWEN